MSGNAGPGRTLTHQPALVVLVCSDDYLLEVEREDMETRWRAAHPSGEIVALDPIPERLIQEALTPSLFASSRLLVVREAASLLGRPKGDDRDGSSSPEVPARARRNREEELVAGLRAVPWRDLTVLLSFHAGALPKGPLAVLLQEMGEVHALPLPQPPKPWEQVAVTPAQRQVLVGLIGRVAPGVLDHEDAVDALIECYGFRPRELAQAAQRLLLAGSSSPEAVRAQAGAGGVGLEELEEALIQRSAPAAARFIALLGAGGSLRLFGDRLVDRDGIGAVVAGSLARILRQALAIRRHARRAGLAGELDPVRCSRARWYTDRFKGNVFPRLQHEVEGSLASPMATVKSAWTAHRLFKIAAAYDDTELLRALARFGRAIPEREGSPASAMAAMAPGLLELMQRPSLSASRRVPGG